MAKRKVVSTRVRFEIFKRDAFTCQYCGRTPPAVVLHVDHIVAVANGGGSEQGNLITSCQDCNLGKSSVPLGAKIIPISTARAIEQERFEQSEAYSKFLSEVRAARERDFLVVSDAWISMEGGDSAKFAICGERKTAVETFLRHLPALKIVECLEVAESKKPINSHGFLRYFCGVCWTVIKGKGRR